MISTQSSVDDILVVIDDTTGVPSKVIADDITQFMHNVETLMKIGLVDMVQKPMVLIDLSSGKLYLQISRNCDVFGRDSNHPFR